MQIIELLQMAALIVTIGVGLVALIAPRSVTGFTGLQAPGARGLAELRAILGGLFVGLGLAPLLLRTPEAYRTVGLTYLAIGVGRAASIAVDRSTERSNLISLVVEIAFGILLVL